jgi:hypothetical protein
MKATVKTLETKSTKKDLNKKIKKDTVVRVKIPRSDVEQFTIKTIARNRALFRRLARSPN